MTSLLQERDQLFLDVYSGKKPSRVPITVSMMIESALEYKNYSLLRELYSPAKCYEAADEIAPLIDSDTLPVSPYTQAAVFRYIGQKFMEPGDDGFFQHANFAPMELEEYPEFNKDALAFVVNKIQPRVFKILGEDPILGHLKIKIAREIVDSQFAGMTQKLCEKHQRSSLFKLYMVLWAPFDYISDYVRSFSTLLTDIRRKPEWVLDACQAVLEMEINQIKALPEPKSNEISAIHVPLHMAPYMKQKDVEKFFWPTFKKFVVALQQKGYMANLHCEQNWDTCLYLLEDLPGRVVCNFESSDQKLIVKTVPARHVYAQSYPAVLLRTGTKAQCVDEAKRTLDNLAGAGNYIFCPNKPFIRGNDINIENLQATIQCVKDYGKY